MPPWTCGNPQLKYAQSECSADIFKMMAADLLLLPVREIPTSKLTKCKKDAGASKAEVTTQGLDSIPTNASCEDAGASKAEITTQSHDSKSTCASGEVRGSKEK
jgi:hypothetical protein